MIIKKTKDGEVHFNRMSHPGSKFRRINDIELFDIVSTYASNLITYIDDTDEE